MSSIRNCVASFRFTKTANQDSRICLSRIFLRITRLFERFCDANAIPALIKVQINVGIGSERTLARVTCFTRGAITNNARSRGFLQVRTRRFSSSLGRRTTLHCDANVIRTLIWEFHGWHRKFKFIPPSTPLLVVDRGACVRIRICAMVSCASYRMRNSAGRGNLFHNKVAYLAYRFERNGNVYLTFG